MRCPRVFCRGLIVGWLGLAGPVLLAGDISIATAVSARAGNGYQRESGADGSFKPEYYAISNGGRVYGTTTDTTIDRVTYPEVAAIAMRLLAGQNYHLGRNSGEATLLIVLQWGATLTYNRGNYENRVNAVGTAFGNLRYAEIAAFGDKKLPPGGRGLYPRGSGPEMGEGAALAAAAESSFESEMLQLMVENRMRDHINQPNARLLGFVDEIDGASRIPRHTAAATRYDDLIADIEDPRYYIIVSAYDFQELHKNNKKKLLWVTRVSVSARGNGFDDSAAAMLKSAAKYFGQDSGKLIRGQEDKGTVQLGDVEFMGEAKNPGTKTPDPAEAK
jgi:hypothetical protein